MSGAPYSQSDRASAQLKQYFPLDAINTAVMARDRVPVVIRLPSRIPHIPRWNSATKQTLSVQFSRSPASEMATDKPDHLRVRKWVSPSCPTMLNHRVGNTSPNRSAPPTWPAPSTTLASVPRTNHMGTTIAVAVTAIIGWWLGKNTVVQPPEEIEDYLFWQAKDLTDFKLTGANSKILALNDLKGKWSFIFFGYTHCPDVCPLTMGVLGQAFRLLEKDPAASQEIQGIFISVDPKRDTPELLKEYVAYFNNKFTGVTGDTAQLDALARQMSALYTIHPKEPEKPGDTYLVSHNSTIFLVDPQGRLYGRFPPPQAPQEIAEVFIKIRTFYNERIKKQWVLF